MIFLGAGASAPFHINTTPKITQRVERILIDETDLLKDIKKYLKKHNYNYNYEYIVTILTAFSKPSEIHRDHFSRLFVTENSSYKKNYTNLLNKIYDYICETCESPFDPSTNNYLSSSELNDIYKKTYDPLFGVILNKIKRRDIIFSTNYDPSIEIWCQKRFLNCIDGTRDIYNPEFKQILQNNYLINELKKDEWKSGGESFPLVRLHGSIRSYSTKKDKKLKLLKSKSEISLIPTVKKSLKKRPRLIFPGQEEQLSRGEWDDLYGFYKEHLNGVCLFIGYSFRHEVLNRPIIENLKSGRISKLGILSPHPKRNLKNLFEDDDYPEERVVLLPAEFGQKKAISLLCEKWVPEAYEENMSSEKVLLEAKKWKITRNQLYF